MLIHSTRISYLNISGIWIYLDKLLLTCAWFDLLSADMIFVSLIYIYVSICIYPYLSAWSFRYSKVGELLDLYMAISQERRLSKVVYNGSWNARSFFLCVHHIDRWVWGCLTRETSPENPGRKLDADMSPGRPGPWVIFHLMEIVPANSLTPGVTIWLGRTLRNADMQLKK